MAVDLVYETHSLTTDNEAGIATGWLPGELSQAGRDLARDLGWRRRADNPAAVFASDLARAVQTAYIAFGDGEIPVHLDRRLRECDYGDLNGAPVATVAAQRRRRIDEPFPGGESYRQVVDRTRDFLADLVTHWDGRRVVVISHSANRWALDHLLHGAALDDLVDAPFNWREGWHYVVASG
jgi:alpha-ribazole phosphatase/probable phosphoglycerate mutase